MTRHLAAAALLIVALPAVAGEWFPVYSYETKEQVVIDEQLDTRSITPTKDGIEFTTRTTLQSKKTVDSTQEIYATWLADCKNKTSHVMHTRVVTGTTSSAVPISKSQIKSAYPSGHKGIDSMFVYVCNY